MTIKLNHTGQLFMQRQIAAGKVVRDERDAWSEHQPSTEEENAFIETHGFAEYARWHLGIDDREPAGTKAHYKFPCGDFKKVHRCGVISAESRAGQYKHRDIETAAHRLHELIDARVRRRAPSSAARSSRRT
ncbi:MAG: hypothetical protein JWP01_1964 [Myxococcales bacterium]|nr:hypothetical protein [Myxococcales bacterium]